MTFASRNVVILAKVETSPGVYTAPANTDAVMIGSNYQIRHRIGRADRDNLRPWMGGADQLNAFTFTELEFTTELASSGTPGTAPAWGKLMRAAGFAETVVAGVLVHYTPITDTMETLSFSCFYGGVKLNMRGARVSRVSFDLGVNGVPRATWTVVGVPRGAPDDQLVLAAAGTPNFSTWQLPRVVLNETGTQNVYLGRSYNVTNGNLTGGTNFATKGMSVVVDNDCEARPFLGWGGDHAPIVDRTVSAQVMFDLAAQARIDFYAATTANSYTSLDLVLGNSTDFPGGTLKFFMPRCGYQDPTNDDDSGLLLSGYSFNALPNSGNDDIYITAM